MTQISPWRNTPDLKKKKLKDMVEHEDEDDCFIDFETEFPAIVFNNIITSNTTLLCAPTVSPLNKNKIDFRISLDESDDEDYTETVDRETTIAEPNDYITATRKNLVSSDNQ
ncbi:hypothetical protein Tco_0184305 [Tanacetum coccineum]